MPRSGHRWQDCCDRSPEWWVLSTSTCGESLAVQIVADRPGKICHHLRQQTHRLRQRAGGDDQVLHLASVRCPGDPFIALQEQHMRLPGHARSARLNVSKIEHGTNAPRTEEIPGRQAVPSQR